MKTIEIKGSLRSETGKKMAKVYRKNEQVPAILYGGDVNVMIVVNERDLRPIVYTPTVHIVNINIDGKIYESIVKDIQFHPVSDKILHIDFLHVFDDKKVTVALPVLLTGQAEGAKQGGKVLLITRKLRACGFPQELPEILEVDVTNLGLGKTIMVGDLNFKNVELIDLKSTVVASVQLTRAAKGTVEEAAAAPAAENKA
ncbi:MAG: 50S ribosomal protein L25/general stress protein Ctc [Bacteroidales bacterium]|nr:50S ribosomal protein L25/general stress protein Ctc [Bacteroidales bacterium]